MKRWVQIFTAFVFCFLFALPLPVSAESYSPKNTDITLQFDEEHWYVFTRDNLENNPNLKKINISYDTIHKILYDNDLSIYAILDQKDGNFVEFFIRKTKNTSGFVNLKSYNESAILDAAKMFAKEKNIENYSVYSGKQPFMKLEYLDKKLNYNICEFVTIVNKENYTLTFQSLKPFNDAMYDETKKVVDSASFKIKEGLPEEPPRKKEQSTKSFLSNVVIYAIIGAVVGGIVGVIYSRRKKKKERQNETGEK